MKQKKNNLIPAEMKIIKGEVHTLFMQEPEVCPDCGSNMKVIKDGYYEEKECLGCGRTETQHTTRYD